jgi:hypothetical protein
MLPSLSALAWASSSEVGGDFEPRRNAEFINHCTNPGVFIFCELSLGYGPFVRRVGRVPHAMTSSQSVDRFGSQNRRFSQFLNDPTNIEWKVISRPISDLNSTCDANQKLHVLEKE